MRTTPRVLLVFLSALMISGAARAQKFTDCGMGSVNLLLPDQKPPKGPGCGGITTVMDIVAARLLADSAMRGADANAKKLAADGADALVGESYGHEVLTEGADAATRVAEKEIVWKAVHEILLAERVKVRARKDDDEGEDGAEAAAGRAKELNALATRINAADAILKDVAADKARLKAVAAKEKGAETDAAVLKRKAALFAKLAPPKKKE